METIALLKKLIRFKTTADRIEEITACVAFIQDLLSAKGIYTNIEMLADTPVLYACTTKTKHPDLLLVPHIDVVAAAESQFIPRQKGDRLYGRGACDNKHNTAIIIQTLLAMANTGASVGAHFITDEEIGGKTTQLLVQKGYVGKINLMLDADQAVVHKQKGVCNITLTVPGTSAHGSEPWTGDNAIEKAMQIWGAIQKLFPPVSAFDHWKRTANLALISGGDLINKVPDSCTMQVNIRYTENDDLSELIQQIQKTAGTATVVQTATHPYFYTDPHAPAVQQFKAIMERELNRTLPLVGMDGATDAHNFGGINEPVVVSGIGGGGGMHGENEWVSLTEIHAFEKALLAYTREVCGV